MEQKEISKNIKKTMNTAVDSIKASAKNVKLPEIKMPRKKNAVQEEKNPSQNELSTAMEQTTVSAVVTLSTKSSTKIIYYLMVVDGEVFHNEEEKFDSVCSELDPDFAAHKEGIIRECKAQMDKIIDSDDFYDVIQDGVEEAIIASTQTEDTFITPKLLVWDLLTIAYGDGKYNEVERKLVKYIVRKLAIGKDVFLEMENSILTMMDLENELHWIKTTDRPYLTIEMMVNEIADRKNVIFESIKDLISL